MEQIDEIRSDHFSTQARAQSAVPEAIEPAHLYMKIAEIKGEASCTYTDVCSLKILFI